MTIKLSFRLQPTLLIHDSVVHFIQSFEDVIAKIPSSSYKIQILPWIYKSVLCIKIRSKPKRLILLK